MGQGQGRAAHWDDAYRSRGVEGVSWFQPEPTVSLALLDALKVGPEAAVIDIGGGASTLVDQLVRRGYQDLAVLDISAGALEEGRARVGDDAPVTWVHEDVLSWQPERTFDLWHDRAVFHFLIDPQERRRYLSLLAETIEEGGGLIMGTFAEDGPEFCSGLPVSRYSAAELTEMLGGLCDIAQTKREVHVTPAGSLQPFTWVAGTKLGASHTGV
jgi:SAM-dependent methyltransferase